VSTRTPEQLETLRGETLTKVEEIRGERAVPAKPSNLCRWCEYREGCSASPVRNTDIPSYERRPKVQEAAALAIASGVRRRRPAPTPPGQLALPLGRAAAL
jgi:hypothetical protein